MSTNENGSGGSQPKIDPRDLEQLNDRWRNYSQLYARAAEYRRLRAEGLTKAVIPEGPVKFAPAQLKLDLEAWSNRAVKNAVDNLNEAVMRDGLIKDLPTPQQLAAKAARNRETT